MTNASRDRKISDFLAQSAIPSDAQLTYISNGVNYRISIADFLASIGVTGTIVQAGAPTATPILDKAGSVNQIRNIEDGPGIKSSVSPQNGATIEHNFIEDTAGAKLVTDLTVAQPKFRSLIAGAGISVAQAGDRIQIALSGAPASTKTVIVNDVSDFPPPVAGVIQLDDNVEYQIQNDITLTERFQLGNNCVLSGSDNLVVSITNNFTGVLFTAASKSWTIKNLRINVPNGVFMDHTGTGNEIWQCRDCVLNVDRIGNLEDFRGVHIDDTQMQVQTDGFTFAGANGVLLLEANLSLVQAGTLYNLGSATFASFSVVDAFVTLNGSSEFLRGAANSANIDSGGLGSVINCRFFGVGTVLVGVTPSDVRWGFRFNNVIEESVIAAVTSQRNNAVNTVITTVNTPVKLAGTWANDHQSRVTIDATGRITFTGEAGPEHVDLAASLTVNPVSGTNVNLTFYFARNGTVIANSGSRTTVDSGNPSRISVLWHIRNLVAGDYIEVFAENNTNTVDVLCSYAVVRLSGLA